MSKRSSRFLIGISVAIFATLLLALVAAGAYVLGRQSAAPLVQNQSASQETAERDDSPPRANSQTDNQPSEESASEESASQEMADEEELESDAKEPEIATPLATIEEQTESELLEGATLNLDEEDLKLVLEVWDIIDREFDGELPDDAEVTYRAIGGSLELLEDQFTRFMPPDIAERSRQQLDGSFEGIGAFVDLNEEGFLVIVRPIEGQPADLAGIVSGDIVTHVDGNSILGKTLEAIIADVKGPKGTEVKLTIVRESNSEPFDVSLVRDLIEIPIVESEVLQEDIGYIRLSSFSGNASEQLEGELDRLLKLGTTALIFDLRDNPGGLLSQSVAVADIFLPDGVVLYQRDSGGVEEIFESDNGDLGESIPLVVLINSGSASASEIVAGAIQDRDRGMLIGETTLGKGSVQQTHTLSDGSELRVTIARWYTPDDKSIDEQGVLPDINVETPDEFGGEDDSQLQRAIEYLISSM